MEIDEALEVLDFHDLDRGKQETKGRPTYKSLRRGLPSPRSTGPGRRPTRPSRRIKQKDYQ
eukprot:11415422-Prorocentrum_lima.AAC.1